MRGVSRWASRVTPLLAAFLVLGAASAWAEEPTAPTDPPGARLNPPVGATTQARLNPPVGIAPPPPDATTQARAQPPVGVSTQARMNPPVGGPTSGQASLFDTILIWLQSRLSVPNG
jgi:hypothetical protein